MRNKISNEAMDYTLRMMKGRDETELILKCSISYMVMAELVLNKIVDIDTMTNYQENVSQQLYEYLFGKENRVNVYKGGEA